MSDEIKDLDDVEAIAWALAWPTVWAFSNRSCDVAAENADECVRLLRERRGPVSAASVVSLATRLAAACGREADAAAVERAKIVAWLRLKDEEDTWAPNSSILGCAADAIERGEHDR